MSLDAGIWGGDDNPAAILVTEVIRSLLPVLERFGIAKGQEVAIQLATGPQPAGNPGFGWRSDFAFAHRRVGEID